ncbi:hypothetical protein EDB86DRAFT_520813 [Lactarius hatsudake]|nr:hypothetical protein EDB86DRAFT_520813 [Lactarius hatsudake]
MSSPSHGMAIPRRRPALLWSHPSSKRQSSVFSSHAHYPHTPPHSSNLDALSGCEGGSVCCPSPSTLFRFGRRSTVARAYKKALKSPSLTGHSRLGATERRSVTPPPPSPSEDHYASPLLPSLRSCSGVSCVRMPLAPAQALPGLNSLWLVLLPLAGNC